MYHAFAGCFKKFTYIVLKRTFIFNENKQESFESRQFQRRGLLGTDAVLRGGHWGVCFQQLSAETQFLLKLGQNSKRRRPCFTFPSYFVLLPVSLGSETWVGLHSKVSSAPFRGCSSPGGVFCTALTLVQARTPGCEPHFLRCFVEFQGSL